MSRQLLSHWQSEEDRYEDLAREAPHDDEALDRIRQHLQAVLILSEPYDRVYYDIRNGTEPQIKEYIQWDLEREHGNLGLGSANSLKPPESSLGKALARCSNSRAADRLVDRIVHKADRDITQARLRLDLVRGARTIDDTEFAIDQLPDSVTSLFEAGIKSIQEQEEPLRTVGLTAVCLVTEGHVDQGVEPRHFLKRLQALCNQEWIEVSESHSLDSVLHACRGFLSVSSLHDEDEDARVVAYHSDFFFYVLEDYNEGLSAVRRGMVAI
ncbi:hypothetical protein SLS58_005619 [Diplodia intermedia]|uniref:Uncharacterized protein n=1 Tax=Diplodia intermedia TaxID=856260 RepID=A0ABR3TQ56_9PEZI